jgi:hypothetical protein
VKGADFRYNALCGFFGFRGTAISNKLRAFFFEFKAA